MNFILVLLIKLVSLIKSESNFFLRKKKNNFKSLTIVYDRFGQYRQKEYGITNLLYMYRLVEQLKKENKL